ncbi:MAG: sulfatase-like hydrolase/transferase [Isosphaeraceae bacterium]
MAAILLPIAFGLAAGYLDVAIIVWKKYFWNDLRNYENASDFPWSVPVGHAVLLLIPGVLLAAVARLRPRPISLQAACWLFATLGIWFALLRMPLYGIASLILAAGSGRLMSGVLVSCYQRRRLAWSISAGLLGLLVILAAFSTGRLRLRESRALVGLPSPPSNARNVVLIVWDTVRASNLSLYGYPRDTTPNLLRWARKGVRYTLALSTAPWTYPSHCSFFTGKWPFQVDSQSKYELDPRVPTLAGYLASRGYQTAGFSANTTVASYETGLDRGFDHFEDFPLTLRSLLSRTVAGSWILQEILYRGDFHAAKWIRLQSRDAGTIHDAFLDWLRHRRRDRPFFAYLNDFDAHDPYVPPPGDSGRFGIRPRSSQDYRFLLDYGAGGMKRIQNRDAQMARDCYDDCIAYLDDQLGRLLDELQGQGLLEDTIVIITADHGESFGDHGMFLHPTSLYLDQTHVPLVILSPDAPAGRVVAEPVSLRDLPATVVDRLGLSAGSPFPGRSLAAYWSATPGEATSDHAPVLSEYTTPAAFRPQSQKELGRRGVQMSLVAEGRHYIRDGLGSEQLYDLKGDRSEGLNLMNTPEGQRVAGAFRRMLLDTLTDNPGTIELENAYLKPYRQWLKYLPEERPAPTRPKSATGEPSSHPRE